MSSPFPGPWQPTGITVDPDGYFHGYDENGQFVDGAFVIADPEARPKRAHKPSRTATLRAAKRAGATAVVLPDGTRVTFGEPEQSAPTELDDWIAKHAH